MAEPIVVMQDTDKHFPSVHALIKRRYNSSKHQGFFS
jgi:hypothetical protein